MEKILIMGRGKSLIRIEEIPEDITTVMLINAFWKWEYGPSYLEDEKLFNYLKDKEIILIINNCLKYNEKDFGDFVKNFNIKEKFSPVYGKGRRKGIPRRGCKYFPDICAERFIKLEANDIKLESTLFHGVLLASEHYKFKDIYILLAKIGMK